MVGFKFKYFSAEDLEKKLRVTRDEALKQVRSYNALQSILQTGVDFSLGQLLNEPCEKCGEKEVYCGNVDLGGVDYYDNYWHICTNCLETKHCEEFSTYDYGVRCPFCDEKIRNQIVNRLKERRKNFSPDQWESRYIHLYDNIKSYQSLSEYLIRGDINEKIFAMREVVPLIADLLRKSDIIELSKILRANQLTDRRYLR